jgi:monoamine oxidase
MATSPVSSSRPTVVDVIVVGAGLSGLRSAYLLQKAGLSTVVLEARDRVGGKTLTTDRVDGITIRQEYGAAWINDSNQSHIWELARELGITAVLQKSEGKVVAQDLDGSCVEFPYGAAPVVSALLLDSLLCLNSHFVSTHRTLTRNNVSLSVI